MENVMETLWKLFWISITPLAVPSVLALWKHHPLGCFLTATGELRGK
jgi:hypothetical protein